ncbi:MAG: class I SAM-dependent methyltransferase, partial [Tsuneonella sp.]
MTAPPPPPFTALTRHPMLPDVSHDEAARFNFLAGLNQYLSGAIGAGNRLAYEKRVLPAFRAEQGRDPEHRYEVRDAMNRDPWHRFWSGMKRNSMEMRQHNGRQVVLRQLDALDAMARQFNEHSGQLELDPEVEQPFYQTAVDIHCQPGGYHGEERPGDVSVGANYDVGIFATTGGQLGGLNDGGGQAVAAWARREYPDWQPRRILDVGVTVGHNAIPIAQAYPDAEVIAIDTAAASLRYGAARAAGLGVKNIRFVQASGEDLSRWP